MAAITNEVTRLWFRQYGVDKLFTYYGSLKDAKTALQCGYGTHPRRIKAAHWTKNDGYMPLGYHSIDIL
jgi:hypothetical protein